jgi:hypothetical protein
VSQRLRDIVHDVAPERVPAHLRSLAGQADALASRVNELPTRSDRSIALRNFCLYVAAELRRLATMFPADVAGLAWVTRNLFEANLTVRYVIQSEQNLREWLGQSLRDEKDFIEGILAFAEDQPEDRNKGQLRKRLQALSDMAERHGLEFARPYRVDTLARDVGEYEEYIGLFKLLSKYVHPSSLLVNTPAARGHEDEWANLFLIKAQVYAGGICARVTEALGLEDAAAT